MMTDKDKLTTLLKEFGIGFSDDGTTVRCKDGMDKVGGYGGFYTDFEFDADGKFIKMGALEE